MKQNVSILSFTKGNKLYHFIRATIFSSEFFENRLELLLDNKEAKIDIATMDIRVPNKHRAYVHKVYRKVLPLAKEVFRLTPNERTAFNEILAALEDSRGKR